MSLTLANDESWLRFSSTGTRGTNLFPPLSVAWTDVLVKCPFERARALPSCFFFSLLAITADSDALWRARVLNVKLKRFPLRKKKKKSHVALGKIQPPITFAPGGRQTRGRPRYDIYIFQDRAITGASGSGHLFFISVLTQGHRVARARCRGGTPSHTDDCLRLRLL